MAPGPSFPRRWESILSIIPIYFYTNPVLLSKHIKNFHQSMLGTPDFKLVYMG